MVTQAGLFLKNTMWGMLPKDEGNVGCTKGEANLTPVRPIGTDGQTFDDLSAIDVNKVFGNFVREVSPRELQYGDSGRGLLTGVDEVTSKSGLQYRDIAQVGTGTIRRDLIAGTFNANLRNDGKPNNFWDQRLRPWGVGSSRNLKGTRMAAYAGYDRWFTSASFFTDLQSNLSRVVGNPSSPEELAGRLYEIQYHEQPTSTGRVGDNVVANGAHGRVFLAPMGVVQGDEAVTVIYSNINPENQNRPFHEGIVGLAGREGSPTPGKPNYDPEYYSKPAGLSRKAGENGQWLFEYLARAAWNPERYYNHLDQLVRGLVGYVG